MCLCVIDEEEEEVNMEDMVAVDETNEDDDKSEHAGQLAILFFINFFENLFLLMLQNV